MHNKLIPQAPGVYCLWNKITNQIYVGSSQDLNKRITQHFSPQCQNQHLKRSIKKYGKDSFSITWLETRDNFLEEEQKLLDYVFDNKIPTFNIAVKAGGNPGGSIEGQRRLCLKGKSKEEWRVLSEAGGGPQQIPLFLIDTETGSITRIDSACEGERLGLGPRQNLSNHYKPNCLKRVKSCLIAKSESAAKSKLEAWLKIPGNNTIDNPIILTLSESESQSALYKLAKVNDSNFSQMYREMINPRTNKPLYSAMQSKADFLWHGTEVKAGNWFRCTKTQ